MKTKIKTQIAKNNTHVHWGFNYISICLDSNNNTELLSEDDAKCILDWFFNEWSAYHQTGYITLYIHKTETLDLCKNLIDYINNNAKSLINIYVRSYNNLIFSEEFYTFCSERKTRLIYDVKHAFTTTSPKFCHKVVLHLSTATIPNLYQSYINVVESNIKYFEFKFISTAFITNQHFDLLYKECIKITDYIKKSYKNNKKTVIPENINSLIFNVLLSDSSNNNIADKFNYKVKCDITNNLITSKVSIGIDKNMYFGDWDVEEAKKYTIQRVYFGAFNIENKDIQSWGDIDKIYFEKYRCNQEQMKDITPHSTLYNCSECIAKRGCTSGNTVLNLHQQRLPYKASFSFCSYYKMMFELTHNLMEEMDNSKNSLFRDYVYEYYSNQFISCITN